MKHTMTTGGHRTTAILLLALCLCCLSAKAQQTTQGGKTDFAWVQMVGMVPGGGNTSVRATANKDGSCPKLLVDGKPMPMTVREQSSDRFPVITCEAYPKYGARHAVVGKQTLNLAPKRLRRIIVLGDTGCRLKGPLVQDCNDPAKWPFAQVTAHAAAKRPDLVIHVGDYYYRESPCPTGHAGCSGSPYGDAWQSWSADFFEPSAPLLAAAPWVLVRGNHEQCGRGAIGWFRTLDAARTVQDCAVNKTSAPFTVELDGLKLHVMDSADTDDVQAPPELVALFAKQYDQLGETLRTGHGWILTHRPIWGLDPEVPAETPGEKKGPAERTPVDLPANRTEQVASDGRPLNGIDMVLAGHVHLFTALSYGPARPVQLIVGNGGDDLTLAVAGPPVRTESIDGMEAHVYQIQKFGYVLLERRGKTWKGTAFAVDDTVMGRCRFQGREATCEITQPPAR